MTISLELREALFQFVVHQNKCLFFTNGKRTELKAVIPPIIQSIPAVRSGRETYQGMIKSAG
ncbi:hypothetical protein HMPREF3155_08400 [Corynebacterium sp. HMSC06D04]|nr:hypothetical protein HMPREF3169_06055 [Corynebacterium sp. HMSC08C04]OFT50919.1 hypothetical protein HMPREF3155_08400 [Corynebacterium sp. HMSC06D04]